MTEIILNQAASEAIMKILDDDVSDPVATVQSAGLDASSFFEFGDWRGLDFRKSDLMNISFKGAHLSGASMLFKFASEIISSGPLSLPKFVDSRASEGKNEGVKERDRLPQASTQNSEANIIEFQGRRAAESGDPSGDLNENVKALIAAAMGQNFSNSWIEPIEFTQIIDGALEGTATTSFIASYVSQNHGEQIISILRNAGFQVEKILVKAIQSNRRENYEPKPVDVQSEERENFSKFSKNEKFGAKLDSRFRFDNFVVGKPNELAHAASKRLSTSDDLTFNPLFLYGGVGLGKTHLMQSIAWETSNRRPDLEIVYCSAEQFMYRFVRALRDKKMMEFKDLFRSIDVLMVDDVQFMAGKDSTQEEFFHTFNALVSENKQVIISADRAPNEIKDLELRIASRLQSGLIVDLHPTDYELRLGILQQKTEEYFAKNREIVVDSGVYEFLAQRISSNARVLEGALNRLFAFSSLSGNDITIELTQECLADVLRASDRKITIEEIQRKVSEHFNIRLSDLIGPRRTRNLARPRNVAMYLAKHLTSRSFPEIGRQFGGRDHTTIMHGVRKIEELKRTDSQIAEDVEMLRRALEA